MSYVDDVDDAIDTMLAADPTLTSFDRNDLAAALGVWPDKASTMLQVHRASQPGGYTRHVVVARGYARGARWFLLSNGAAGERLTLGHGAYIAADLNRRAQSDIAGELSPAALRHPAVALAVRAMAAHIERSVNDAVSMINVALQLVQATTGKVADRVGVK